MLCDYRTDRTETGRNQQIDVSPSLDGGRSGYIDSRPPPSNDQPLIFRPNLQSIQACLTCPDRRRADGCGSSGCEGSDGWRPNIIGVARGERTDLAEVKWRWSPRTTASESQAIRVESNPLHSHCGFRPQSRNVVEKVFPYFGAQRDWGLENPGTPSLFDSKAGMRGKTSCFRSE